MVKLVINENKKLGTIAPEIYGHFSEHLGRCIYEGLYVGEDSDIPNVNGMRKDVVEALREINVPVLRWPGGCFADEYHWKDGIGDKAGRKKMVNTHWGGVTEDNSFGTHEFMELCRQIRCKTYVNGNMGSGSVQEMSEWVEYMTFGGLSPMSELRKKNGHEEPWKVDYFGVGNENWGCGGNMTPEYYGNEYRRYQTYIRQYDKDSHVAKIACGANAADYHWTEQVLRTCFRDAAPDSHGMMDLLSLHYYTVPGEWNAKGSATQYSDDIWYLTLSTAYFMEELLRRHIAVMDQFDPEKKIGLSVDEWGTWFDVEEGTNPGFLYQQSTVRDALVAGISLNILNKHCDRVRMACIAQMVNVLQAVILTDGERMIKTPTWHVFNQYKHHQGAELLESSLSGVGEYQATYKEQTRKAPKITESVSEKDGIITITLNNAMLDEEQEISVSFAEDTDRKVVEATVVTSGDVHDHNTFDAPETVHTEEFKAYQEAGRSLTLTLPKASVVMLRVK